MHRGPARASRLVPAAALLAALLAPALAQISQDDAVSQGGTGVNSGSPSSGSPGASDGSPEALRAEGDRAFEEGIRRRVRGWVAPQGGFYHGDVSPSQPAPAARPAPAAQGTYGYSPNPALAGQLMGGFAGSFFSLWGRMAAETLFGPSQPSRPAPAASPAPAPAREEWVESEDPETTAALQELARLHGGDGLEDRRRLLEALESQFARIASASNPTAQLLCAACYSKRAASFASQGRFDDAGLLASCSLDDAGGSMLGSEACPDCPGGFPGAFRPPAEAKELPDVLGRVKKEDEKLLAGLDRASGLQADERRARERVDEDRAAARTWDDSAQEIQDKAPRIPAPEKPDADALLKEALERKRQAEANLKESEQALKDIEAQTRRASADVKKDAAPLAGGSPSDSILPD